MPALAARSIEHGRVSDTLHERRMRLLDQFGDHGVACVSVLARHLHLDQFVVLQHFVEFGDECRRHALASNLEQRFEVMGLTAQEPGLGGGKDNGHAGTAVGKGVQGIMAAFPATALPAVAKPVETAHHGHPQQEQPAMAA